MSNRQKVYRAILILVTVTVGIACLRLLWMGAWDELLQVGVGGLFLLLLDQWKDYGKEEEV